MEYFFCYYYLFEHFFGNIHLDIALDCSHFTVGELKEARSGHATSALPLSNVECYCSGYPIIFVMK